MIDYTLKKAAKDDMLLLYHWANDEDVRNHSFSSNFIGNRSAQSLVL